MNGHKACKLCKHLEKYIPVTIYFITIIPGQNKKKHMEINQHLHSHFFFVFFFCFVCKIPLSFPVFLSYAGMCVHSESDSYNN